MKTFVTVLLVAGMVAAGAGGALLGLRLGERASEPGHDVLLLTDPTTLAGAPEDALRSAGGFTGFGGPPALSGQVARVGAVELPEEDGEGEGGEETQPRTFFVGGEGGTLRITYLEPVRIFRIGPLTSPLAPGDVVAVRYAGDEVTGVLRVPADLEEGTGAGGSPRQRGIVPDDGGE